MDTNLKVDIFIAPKIIEIISDCKFRVNLNLLGLVQLDSFALVLRII